MGIETGVGFESLRTRRARVFAFGFVDAADVIGQRAFADERSIALRAVEVALLLVNGQHVVAFAAAIGEGLRAFVAGKLSADGSRRC